MIMWLLALFTVVCTAVVGFYQGALRTGISFIGLLFGALLAVPLGSILYSLLPIFGLKNPWLVLIVAPFIAFAFVMVIFKVAALAVHKKVDGYYKYKANDTQRLLFERLNTRVGIVMGLANGVVYVFAISTLLYAIAYLTVQVATSSEDSWALRLVNRVADDMESTRVDKAAARFLPKSARYYDSLDIVSDLFQTPLLQNRLANYPPFLLLGENEEFKPFKDQTLQKEWIKGMTFGTFINHESVKPLVEDRKAYTNILARLEGDAHDLKVYLETGKSPKYDDERILGRWEFDFRASMNLARRRKPNMGSAEIKRLRQEFGVLMKDAALVATVDNRVILKLPSQGKDKTVKGSWKTSGSSYILTTSEEGKKLEGEANVDGKNLFFNKGGSVMVFENSRV
ncbi:MAG TPA: CvpA family protein [Verrucomicrobiae bacterium]|nr:CvpA family protein [Verrucomicrobiae bacterium]